MTNTTEFTPPPTCPSPTMCVHAGECMASYFLHHELTTKLPRQEEAIDALITRAACTDPGFVETLWHALTRHISG